MKKTITGLLLIAAILISGCDTKPSETVQSLSSEQSYHSDPTWALKDTEHTDRLHLYYFLMDDTRRSERCPVKDLQSLILPNYQESRSNTDFAASDDRLLFPQAADFDSLDEDKKAVHYRVAEESQELKYK